jgi:hypothetical protein
MKGGERVDQDEINGKIPGKRRKLTFKSPKTDPLGSYTGVPDGNEQPQQDADDL